MIPALDRNLNHNPDPEDTPSNPPYGTLTYLTQGNRLGKIFFEKSLKDKVEKDGYIVETFNNKQISETISREEDNLIQEFNSSDPESSENFREKIENFRTSFSPKFEHIKVNSFDHQSSTEDVKSMVQRFRNQRRNG